MCCKGISLYFCGEITLIQEKQQGERDLWVATRGPFVLFERHYSCALGAWVI